MKNADYFKKPVIILGAPRSGTTLLQKIIREQPGFASMAKESDLIWNRYFHPQLSGWDSEMVESDSVGDKTIQAIRNDFRSYILSSDFWEKIKNFDIMQYRRNPYLSFLVRNAYRAFASLRRLRRASQTPPRIVEKTIANCFRLEVVDRVFTDAVFIYLKRDGRPTINSIINGWLDPNRFAHYRIPMKLSIPGYNDVRWNFVLPPGWKEYVNRPLEEIAAFQWVSVHRAILGEICKERYKGRILAIKLEELIAEPYDTLKKITEFADIPWSSRFDDLSNDLPVVNSPDGNPDQEKWKNENYELIKRIEPMIRSTMEEIGYNMD